MGTGKLVKYRKVPQGQKLNAQRSIQMTHTPIWYALMVKSSISKTAARLPPQFHVKFRVRSYSCTPSWCVVQFLYEMIQSLKSQQNTQYETDRMWISKGVTLYYTRLLFNMYVHQKGIKLQRFHLSRPQTISLWQPQHSRGLHRQWRQHQSSVLCNQ